MKYRITLNERTYEVEVEVCEPMALAEFTSFAPVEAAPVAAAPVEAAPAAAAAPAPVLTGAGDVVPAPMPGTILKVAVEKGQAVKEGQLLVILEAMKMENEILSPKNGTITQVLVQQGVTVNTGDPLVMID
jgi:glutaconyl-CoA decarboxylase